MVNQTIQIFARVKPTKARTGPYIIDEDSSGNPRLTFSIPKDIKDGLINNRKEQYKFRFKNIFEQNSMQDEVFDSVAKPVADNVLEGYNGTIFAYGQTGSGKTFTITGGPEKFADRGIIPRTLSYMFDTFEKYPDQEFSTHISYLEIYNENGYDLLDPKHEASKLEDLPKVTLFEDTDQNIHLKNLSLHPAANEEDALNLLFLGDTNRMIAETPMNQASTRSHCIFTIHVVSRVVGSATVRRSKLHLVDLAGSERIGKTGTQGLQATEAKYINLSLHYLEQVIVALSEKNRQHIPYRNSMMTSVLRDSLGGNCMTTMIATCSVERLNIDESISTCRFAQRVALIKNEAILNEELDPKLMIGRLKREIQVLKEELALATGEQRTDDLSNEEKERCSKGLQNFLDDRDADAILSIGGDMRKIQYCFRLLKTKLSEKSTKQALTLSAPNSEITVENEEPAPSVYEKRENKKLQQLIQQRDTEINILVEMLKKEKRRTAAAVAQSGADAGARSPIGALPGTDTSPVGVRRSQLNGHRESRYKPTSDAHDAGDVATSYGRYKNPTPPDTAEQRRQATILGEMSLGRQEAYEIFRRDYHLNVAIDDNKQTLKQRYAEAKSLGEQVNEARNQINKIKGRVEQHRMSLVMQGRADSADAQPDRDEMKLIQSLEAEKENYRVAFARLRNLKTEIEHLQHLLEKQKMQTMKDFEIWWAEQSAAVEAQQKLIHSLPKATSRKAWRTPSVSPMGQVTSSSGVTLAPPDRDARPPSVQSFTPSESQYSVTSDSYRLGPLRAAPTGLPSGKTFVKSSQSQEPKRSQSSQMGSFAPATVPNVELTGDPKADADIMAFLKARKELMHRMKSQNR